MATKTISEITINKIRIGGKAPTKIMKGSSEVKKVTKGSTVVYQKEDVTYTLTGSGGGTVGASNTKMSFTVQSYKGSSTAVAISASNVSVTAGGGSSISVSASGTTYTITITIAANTSTTSSVTHTIKVTQPTSGQSITLSGTQAAKTYYLTLSKIGFRFSGAFPTSLFDLTLNSVYINTNTGSTNVYYETCYGDSTTYGSIPDASTGIWYYNYRSINGPQVNNGDIFGANFSFGGTWAGSTAYQGYTMYMHFRDSTSGKAYITPKSSSKSWQTAVQPTSPLGVQTTFQNITSDVSNAIIYCDVNWSWSSSWMSSGVV